MAKKKQKKSISRSLIEKRYFILMICGLAIMSLAKIQEVVYANTLEPNTSVSQTIQNPSRDTMPVNISIGQMVNVAVDIGYQVSNRWEIHETKATYLGSSAAPRSGGNTIIYGHNKEAILGNIRAVVPGQIITLDLANGAKRTYKVTDAVEVSTQDTSWLDDTDTEVVTVYTCSGLFDSKRFILRAKPVGEII